MSAQRAGPAFHRLRPFRKRQSTGALQERKRRASRHPKATTDSPRLLRPLREYFTRHTRIFLLHRADKFRTRDRRSHRIIDRVGDRDQINDHPLAIVEVQERRPFIPLGLLILVQRHHIDPGPTIMDLEMVHQRISPRFPTLWCIRDATRIPGSPCVRRCRSRGCGPGRRPRSSGTSPSGRGLRANIKKVALEKKDIERGRRFHSSH